MAPLPDTNRMTSIAEGSMRCCSYIERGKVMPKGDSEKLDFREEANEVGGKVGSLGLEKAPAYSLMVNSRVPTMLVS